MSADIGAIRGSITLDDKMSPVLQRGTAGLSGFQRQIAATALGFLGANGLNQAINTVTRNTREMITDYAKLEKNLAEVSTLVDTTTVSMDEMKRGVMDLSRAYGQDSGGLAKALYQTISAGVETGKSLEFLGVATQAAIGGVSDTKTAVDALTSAMNAFGLDAEQATEISDSLFVTIKRGKTTMQELSPAIGSIAPMAAAVGLSLDEMNAGLATLTLSGLSTSEAGTALRGVMNSLLKPADDATKLAKELGIELSASAVKAQGFSKWLKDVEIKTGGSSEALAVLFPEIRGLNAMLQLTGSSAETFASVLEDMTDKTGATAEATEKMTDTLDFKWNTAVEGIAAVSDAFMDNMRPALIIVLDLLADVIEGINYLAMRRTPQELQVEYKDIMAADYREDSGKLRERALNWITQYHQQDPLRLRAAEKYDSKALEIWNERAKAIEATITLTRQYGETAKESGEKATKATNAEIKALEELKKKNAEIARQKALALKQGEKESDEAARKEEDRQKEILKYKTAEQESFTSQVTANLQEQIEHYENLAQSDMNTVAERVAYASKAAEARQALAMTVWQSEKGILDTRRAYMEKEFGQDEERMKAFMAFYNAETMRIENNYNQAVVRTKSINVSGYAQFNNYEDESIYEAAFDGFISSATSAIKSVTAVLQDEFSYWADYYMAAMGVLADSDNFIVSLLGTAGEFGWALAEMFDSIDGEMRRTEEEWASIHAKQREAMYDMLFAIKELRLEARDWLKEIGALDLARYSYKELVEEKETTEKRIAETISGITGVSLEYDQLAALSDYFSAPTLSGIPAKNEPMGIAINMLMDWAKEASKGTGMTAQELVANMLSPRGPQHDLFQGLEQIEEYIQGYDVGGVKPAQFAETFSQAESALKHQMITEGKSQEWYDQQIWPYVQKFWEDFDSLEYAGYQQRAAAAGGGLVETGGVSEDVSPSRLTGTTSGAMEYASSVARAQLDVNVYVYGDTASAEIVGEALGESVTSYFRSQGI